MSDEAVYRTAPATPGLLKITLYHAVLASAPHTGHAISPGYLGQDIV